MYADAQEIAHFILYFCGDILFRFSFHLCCSEVDIDEQTSLPPFPNHPAQAR